jgi:hypothetical protein
MGGVSDCKPAFSQQSPHRAMALAVRGVTAERQRLLAHRR